MCSSRSKRARGVGAKQREKVDDCLRNGGMKPHNKVTTYEKRSDVIMMMVIEAGMIIGNYNNNINKP